MDDKNYRELSELGYSGVILKAFSEDEYANVRFTLFSMGSPEHGIPAANIQLGDLKAIKQLHGSLGKLIEHAERPKSGLPF